MDTAATAGREGKGMEKERRNIPAEMEEEEIDLGLLLITLWRSFRRFWWLVLLLAALGAAGFYGFQYT